MTIVVRRMQGTDRSSWAAMRFQLWNELSVEDHLTDIDRILRGKTRRGYMGLMGEQPVGFAELSVRDYANGCTSQPVPFLEGIWVAKRYRRRGIGRALIAAVTEDLLAEGFQELCSDAGIRNRRSHQAHRTWGFVETDRVVYFRRPLQPAAAASSIRPP